MPARSTKSRRSDFVRFVRHVEQKHGREAAAGAMTAEQLGAVLDRDGLPGVWAGRLAHRVGLRGRTTPDALREVFHDARVVQEDNSGGDVIWNLRSKFDSSTSRPADRVAEALKGSGGVRVSDGSAEDPTGGGFHGMVFGLPKSVSALALVDDPEVLAALEAATEAYRDAVMTILDRMARCRSGRRGVTSERGEGVIGATWIHRGSGTGDPHWHIHIALSNATWREGDAEGRALDGRVLLAVKRLAEAAGLAAMEAALSERLGLGPEAWTRGAAGSVVVPELIAFTTVAMSLSKARSALAEREVAQPTYAADELRWRQQRAADFAAAQRSRKTNAGRHAPGEGGGEAGPAGTPEEVEAFVDLAFAAEGTAWAGLRDAWRAQVGDDWRAAATLFARQRQARPGVRQTVDDPGLDEGGIARAMDDLLRRNATPSFFDFAAVARSHGASDQDSLIRGAMHFDLLVAQRILKSRVAALPIAVALAKGEAVDTAALHAATGVGQPASVTWAAWEADRALQRRAEAMAEQSESATSFSVEMPEGIDGDQRAAMRLAASGRRLSVITGVAGAGKTVSMKPVAEAAKFAGFTVYSTARNASRARETGEGIDADYAMSLALLLKAPRLGIDRPVLVVLDEAGVVDQRDFKALLALAEDPARRIQIVAMGERQQAQPIDGVAAFASIEKGAERAGGVARLAISYRCKAWLKEAEEIRAGEGARVLDRVLADGRLVEAKTEAEAAEAMAEAQLANPGSVALTSTNEEAGRISRLVQRKLGRDGVIPVRHGNKAAVGDRIRARRNRRDGDICNGDEFVVLEICDGHLVVEGKRGRVTMAPDYCRDCVELAYAATIDAAQGVNAKRAIVRVDASLGRSKIYSAATRGARRRFL
jgi:ATP-dependent exoDNAse (exonuclease V), alpha subunit - helicase superfamily I member